jgi:preprotein translocase subunit SecD
MRLAALSLLCLLIAACAGSPRQAEPQPPKASVEFRLLAAEDGPFAKVDVDEYPPDFAARYRWLELAREDAVRGSILARRCPQSDTYKVPVQIIDEYNVTSADVIDVQPTTDSRTGGHAVSFKLSQAAAPRFEAMTRRHRAAAAGGEDPRLLAIVIENRVYAAYSIRDTISGEVQLSGSFTARERDALLRLLRGEGAN